MSNMILFVLFLPVCIKFLTNFAKKLTDDDMKSVDKIDEKFRAVCKKAKTKENRFVSRVMFVMEMYQICVHGLSVTCIDSHNYLKPVLMPKSRVFLQRLQYIISEEWLFSYTLILFFLCSSTCFSSSFFFHHSLM